MAKRIGGGRRKTRQMYGKNIREKGKLSITRFLQEFKHGDRVVMKAEPAYQNGMYFRRFHGKSGLVTKKIGECYEVEIMDGGKSKKLIVHPVHLKRG